MSESDQLAETLADSLNDNSDRKIAYFMDDDDSPSDVDQWVSTGSSVLDLLISNKTNGGVPVGRIVELFGSEGCVTEDTKVRVKIEDPV